MTVLTPAGLHMLRTMAAGREVDEGYEPEITVEGGLHWFGCQRIHRRTFDQLIGLMAISETSDGGGVFRYSINDTGRAIARRPLLAPDVAAAVYAQKPFTIQGDRVVLLAEGA